MLVKESNDPEAAKLKDDIDSLRKERAELISKIKERRRRLSYKEAESAAISRLLAMKKEEDKDGAKRRRIGYLKRMKSRLEFKISTEASSLAQEKDIVRKIGQINSELDDALALVRLERKTELVASDIEECKKDITDINVRIGGLDGRLDEIYSALRRKLNIAKWQGGKLEAKRKKIQQAPVQDINLEDIAVIKKKESK